MQQAGGDAFLHVRSVGAGRSGSVVKAVVRANGTLVALKTLALPSSVVNEPEDEAAAAEALREPVLMRLVAHPHVVPLLDVVPSAFDVVLVLPYAPTDLARVLSARTRRAATSAALAPWVSPPLIKTCMLHLLRALAHVHACRVVHRDVKPGNLLVLADGRLALADFGIARFYASSVPGQRIVMSLQGTRCYRAPEVAFGSTSYTSAVDVWAAGCVMAELLRGEPLFSASVDLVHLQQLMLMFGMPTEQSWPGVSDLPDFAKCPFALPSQGAGIASALPSDTPADAVNLLSRLLCMDPAQRISALDALAHPYFTAPPAPAADLSAWLPSLADEEQMDADAQRRADDLARALADSGLLWSPGSTLAETQ